MQIGTPVARMSKPGWYTYQLVIAGDADFAPVTTPCGVPAETFLVQRQPKVTTTVSSALTRPGTPITDTVLVEGLDPLPRHPLGAGVAPGGHDPAGHAREVHGYFPAHFS